MVAGGCGGLLRVWLGSAQGFWFAWRYGWARERCYAWQASQELPGSAGSSNAAGIVFEKGTKRAGIGLTVKGGVSPRRDSIETMTGEWRWLLTITTGVCSCSKGKVKVIGTGQHEAHSSSLSAD